MSTFRVVTSDDASFTDAVRKAAADSRYAPAERDGAKVPQVFDFAADFGFLDDPPRATGKNVMVIRALGAVRVKPGTPNRQN